MIPTANSIAINAQQQPTHQPPWRKGDHPQPNRVGQFATNTINKSGQVGDDPSKAAVPGTKIAYFEPTTQHNIPDRFWGFLNATGPVSETGQISQQETD